MWHIEVESALIKDHARSGRMLCNQLPAREGGWDFWVARRHHTAAQLMFVASVSSNDAGDAAAAAAVAAIAETLLCSVLSLSLAVNAMGMPFP